MPHFSMRTKMTIKYTKEEMLALNTANCKKPDAIAIMNFSNFLSSSTLISTFFANRTHSCRSELHDNFNNFSDRDDRNDNGDSILVF
jgi:hypothetical protein